MATELAGSPPAPAAQPRRVALGRGAAYAPAIGLACGIVAIAAAQGGYFPTGWGWAALAFLWASALALLLVASPQLGRLEVWFLAAFAAFGGWLALSIVWSSNVSGSVAEVERLLVYAGGFLAFLLVARQRSVELLLAALLTGAATICTYSLATRLFPASISSDTDFFGYRLFQPVGYWNALGLLAALAVLLALGFATYTTSIPGRCLAAATLPVLFATLLYTYSRGAWLALATGLIVAVALSAGRLRLITGILVLAPASVLAVLLAARPEALTRRGATLDAAAQAGHRVAAEIIVLVVVSAACALGLALAERRVTVTPGARRAYTIVLVCLALVAVVAGLAALGHPVRKVENAYHGFVTDSGSSGTDLNQRLFQFSSSGRRDNWRVALEEFKAHPVLGGGIGTFEEHWYRDRSIPQDVRDGHSLYIETLGELGVVGLGLLIAMLAIPFAGARARARPLVPLALGAYTVFLVHAAYDWDWEMPVVTLTGVFCGLAALVAARREETTVRIGSRARGALLVGVACLGAFALVGLVGNMATASAARAIADGKWDRAAAQARRASAWAPWAARPWYLLSQAELGQQRRPASVAALKKAIDRDPDNYTYWTALAFQTQGAERAAALRRTRELIPRFNDLPTG